MSSLWGEALNLDYEIKKFCSRIGAKGDTCDTVSKEVRYLLREVLHYVIPNRHEKNKRENATLDIIDEKRNDLGL